MIDRNVELLAPAGSYESMRAAVSAGADAVYMGGTRFGARAYADNPDERDLLLAIDYVHIHGRKFYLTVNTLLKDTEIKELYAYLKPYYCQGIDGVIVQDIGVIEYVRRFFKGLSIHASTQMTVTSALGARFLKNQGVERVVPARELSLNEIRNLKKQTGMEVECFIHGALCYCYSGQCLFSSIVGGRSGNRGQCAQPCRLPYRVGDGPVGDGLSLKDLCAVDLIPELIDAGIDSFKIEGRMKKPDYVYTVTSIYRKYIDLCLHGDRRGGYSVTEEDRQRLLGAYRRRGYTDGYYHRQNGKEMTVSRPAGTAKAQLSDAEQKKSAEEYKIQEKLKGKFILSAGRRAKLILECRGKTVCAEGALVETALGHPLEISRIERQMKKTGNTEFVFQKLDIDCGGDVFLPMKCLNELRRAGIQKLTEEFTSAWKREVPAEPKEPLHLLKMPGNERTAELSASVQTAEQFQAALSCVGVARIYVESAAAVDNRMMELAERGRRADKQVYFAMPHIFREPAYEFMEKEYAKIKSCYDGVLLRNFDGYEYLLQRGYPHPMTADGNLYLFNRYGREFLRKTSISAYTAPAELNGRELSRLGIGDCALVVYGRIPMMITAGCLKKNTAQCDHREDMLTLTDRCQKKFIVKSVCGYCYNIIYNCVPLVLLAEKPQIDRLNPGELRLDFTVEDGPETKRVLTAFSEKFLESRGDVLNPSAEYTRGHFKRGVK